MKKTFLAVLLVAGYAFATEVNPPVAATIPLNGGAVIRGKITAYSDDGLTINTPANNGETQTVPWSDIQPRVMLALSEKLIGQGTAEQWMDVGRRLLASKDGQALAGRAFAKALKLDPSLKGEIASARADSASAPSSTTPPAGASRPSTQRSRPPTTAPWAELSDAEMEQAVVELKKEMEVRFRQTNMKIPLVGETKYFIFYSNLSGTENAQWIALLDRMYARLAEMFGVPEGKNLWKGKAVIVCFLSRDDFVNFEKITYKNDAKDYSGMCHPFADGNVEITFCRSRSDQAFAQLLVHESTHGFIHRYHSGARIPTWLNEGLAEVMAYELVPHAGLKQSNDARAKSELHRPNPLDKFFSGERIEGFQYPIARTLAEFMIQQNKQGYVDFINAIKDGDKWEDALTKKYGATLDQLVNAYGISMGVKDLKP